METSTDHLMVLKLAAPPVFLCFLTVLCWDLLVRSADGVTSISLAAWYGWKAEAPLPALRSAANRSGLWVPVELALVPSPP